jgi:hypothetical protein
MFLLQGDLGQTMPHALLLTPNNTKHFSFTVVFLQKHQKMDQKIQLLHPAGKHAVRIDRDKYDLVRNSILEILKSGDELTHTELTHALTEKFRKNKIEFDGSLEWYLESVKLDLEARKEIRRKGKSPVRFVIL